MTRFITVHLLFNMPMHNVNRDQDGMPKIVRDGGATRCRISSQALKRAARVRFRDKGDTAGSMTTRDGAQLIVDAAMLYAEQKELTVRQKDVEKSATKLISNLSSSGGPDKKPTVMQLSKAEIATAAAALVHHLAGDGDEPQLVRDSTSPSLEHAAFGRFFANKTEAVTMAAVAVGPAVTSHAMALTPDYFTAVEDNDQGHAGSAHMGTAFFTSGTYLRSFTIDVDQLRRSWQNFYTDVAEQEFREFFEALCLALPTGRRTNTASRVFPHTVLAEEQRHDVAHPIERVVEADDHGFIDPSIDAFIQARNDAVEFQPSNFGGALVYSRSKDVDFSVDRAANFDAIVDFVTGRVFQEQ